MAEMRTGGRDAIDVILMVEAAVMRLCRDWVDPRRVQKILKEQVIDVNGVMDTMLDRGLLEYDDARDTYRAVPGRHPQTPLDIPGLRVAFFAVKDEIAEAEKADAKEPGSQAAAYAKGRLAAMRHLQDRIEAKLFQLDSTALDDLVEEETDALAP